MSAHRGATQGRPRNRAFIGLLQFHPLEDFLRIFALEKRLEVGIFQKGDEAFFLHKSAQALVAEEVQKTRGVRHT